MAWDPYALQLEASKKRPLRPRHGTVPSKGVRIEVAREESIGGETERRGSSGRGRGKGRRTSYYYISYKPFDNACKRP